MKFFNFLLCAILLACLISCKEKNQVKENNYDKVFVTFYYKDTVNKKAFVIINIHSYTGKDTFVYRFSKKYVQIKSLLVNGVNSNYKFIGDSLLVFSKKNITENIIKIDYIVQMDSIRIKKCYLLDGYEWCPQVQNEMAELSINAIIPEGNNLYYKVEPLLKIKGNDTIYSISKNLTRSFILIIAPNNYYTKIEKEINKKKLIFYFRNKDQQHRDSIINECVKTFKFCETNVGDYNRNSFVLIEYPDVGWCASQEGFLIIGNIIVYYYNKLPEFNFWPIHETIHQWIGNGFFFKKVKDVRYIQFYIESLTEFLTWEYIEGKCNNDTIKKIVADRIKEYNTEIKGTINDKPLSANLNNRITYACSPIIYYNIRNIIGKDKWHQFLKEFYNNNKGQFITFDEFLQELSKYLDKKEIKKLHLYLDNKFSYFLSQNKNII